MRSSPIAAKLARFALAAALVSSASAQPKPTSLVRTDPAEATIRSVRALASEDGWAVEVISTRPLVPSLSRAENPPRLIIDLPNARLANIQSRLAFQSSGIAGVRISQFQITVARIVLDLSQPVHYTWDAAGNRLTIRVHPAQSPPRAPSPGGSAAVEPFAPPLAPQESTNSTVVVTSAALVAGSSVTAGADATILRLRRGGEVRVCPGTTVSVTPSQSGRSLLLAMSTGTLEAHYSLGAVADSILTPDFRILLAGPGEFDYAVSTDLRGNTCVRGLPGNRTPLTVSELLGDGSYRVKPNEQAVFRSGHLELDGDGALGSCGCPPGQEAVPPRRYDRQTEPTKLAHGQPFPAAETALLAPSKPDDIQVQVDSSFVFRANDPANGPPGPSQQAELLPVRSLSPPALEEMVLSPPRSRLHHGFFGKIRGFFSAVFG